MYAVIKTGGKQYRVQPGDLLVVEKLAGAPGDAVKLDQVLLVGGEGGELQLGAPTVAGAVVEATLIETRKGEKVKVFKKIRRQGYKRTKGHRQQESVLRVTGLSLNGKSAAKWDGEVDLTPKSVLDLRARNLASRVEAPVEAAPAPTARKAKAAPAAEAHAEVVVEEVAGAEVKAAVVETNAPEVSDVEPKAAKPKVSRAPKAEAAAEEAEAPKAKKPTAPKKPKAAPEGEA